MLLMSEILAEGCCACMGMSKATISSLSADTQRRGSNSPPWRVNS